MTGAVNKPLTFRATATSRRKRARNSGSVAKSARMTFTATAPPPAESPRNTCPDRKQAAHLPRDRDLAPETRPEFGVGGQVSADDLHRHGAAARRKSKEHLSHAASAQPPAEPVRPDHLWISGL